MRVVFLYTSNGRSASSWDQSVESKNHFLSVHGLPTEGYFHMLKRLKDIGVIDDLIVFIESGRQPGSKVIDGIQCHVVPMIEYVEPFLQKGDVLFVRGGFRGWYDPFLLKMEAQKRWLILYAANTGRQRWMLWNVVLSDLNTNHGFDKRQRAFLMFNKPISPSVFYPIEVERDIDVCIGASKIHDKKAQWRVIDAVIEYQKIYQKNLKCILPGSMKYRGTQTPQIAPKINKHGLYVEMPGFVDRYELNKIYNRSKVYVYLGNSGENDRGPLEATSVGCPTILGGTTRHAPFLRTAQHGIIVSKDPTNPAIVADEIHAILANHSELLRQFVASHFDQYNGFESVVIPQMTRLFNTIRNNPTPNMKCLQEEYL